MIPNRNDWQTWITAASIAVFGLASAGSQQAQANSIQVVHDFTAAEVRNQPGNQSDLVEGPDNKLYGSIAGGHFLFRLDPGVFQPEAFRTLDTGQSGRNTPFIVGQDGRLWGVNGNALVRVSPGLQPAGLEIIDSIGSSLSRAIAHAGTASTTFRIEGSVHVPQDLVVPANIELEFVATGRLILAPGVDLNILGSVTAPPGQWIFEAAADDSIVMAPQLATVYPHWFGARGDGQTNDTRALRLTSQFINRHDGGTISFLPGTYVIGRQHLAGRTGAGCSWCREEVISLVNNSRPVSVLGNGAKLIAADDLRYGSFDPVSGEAVDPPLPVYNADLRADAYTMIDLVGNADATVRDFELDGNIQTLRLGGFWGDTGRQLFAYGVRAYNNERVHMEQLYTHHHGLDGIAIGYTGLTAADPAKPHRLIDITSEYNARQGLSWTGGRGLHVTRGKFNYTGKARFQSAPGAGLDIEAEGAVNRDGLFEDCEFIGNTGAAMVADTGDSADVTFRNSVFWGTTNYAIWPKKPRFRFENCTVYGTVVNAFNATNAADGTVFTGCHFEDRAHPIYGIFVSPVGLIESGASYLQIENSTFRSHTTRGVFLEGVAGQSMRNVTVTHGYSDLPDDGNGFQSIMRNVRLENVSFLEDFAPGTNRHWFILSDFGPCLNVTVSGPLVKWQGVNGTTGLVCP